MSFNQLVAILLARWRIIAGLFLVTVIATFVVTRLMPKQYQATASFVLEAKDGLLGGPNASPNYLNTQLAVITSDRVSRRVVRNLKLTELPALRERWQQATNGSGDLEAWVAELLIKNLLAEPAGKSNVIDVHYKAVDPRFAANIANAFVQAYIDTSLDLRVDPAKQNSAFFDLRSRQYKEQLERAQGKLTAFQKDTGITVTDERLDVETARLNALSGQIVSAEALSYESGSRQAQARGTSGQLSADVQFNPNVAALKADLSRQELALQQLNARYGENHPQIVETRASIADIKSRLDSEMRRATGTVGVSNAINRQREANVIASFEAQRTKVLKLKTVRDEMGMLQREVDNAQRIYDTVVNRLTTNNLESQNTLSNAYILDAAMPPTEPSSPKVVKNMVFAVVLGGMFALAVGLFVEFLNRKVRSVEDVSKGLGLPVIGIMPAPDRRRLLGRRGAQPLLARRVLGQLPSPR
jgi:polysaccharide biosynthesis transport protein